MNKTEIETLTEEKHNALCQWLSSHEDDKWIKGPEGKWTTGQHIYHLIVSAQALNKALLLPKIVLSSKFGKSNRATRTYDEVVLKYNTKLAENPNVESPLNKDMRLPTIKQKQEVINTLTKEKNTLLKRIGKWKEKDLDTYILPHPLLGRMPIREMMMFMGYHTEHHHRILQEKY